MYVDDFLMIGKNEIHIASIKKEMKKAFQMQNVGDIHYYLGIEVTQHPKYIFTPKEIHWRIVEQV